MGLEYKIETYDEGRAKLAEFLRGLPEFVREDDRTFHLGSDSTILFTVRSENDHVYACQHVASREADALLGLVVRRILAVNDHVVISEL